MQGKEARQSRKFRANPVEIAIFSVVLMVFCNSVYNLFYDHAGYHPTILAPMAANPTSENRSPASASKSFVNLDVKCNETELKPTSAMKVRLSGPLCGMNGPTDSHKVKTLIINGANKFEATVFTDMNAGTFSTDYIPLNAEKNPIQMKFVYDDGRTVSQNVTIVKN